MTVENTTGAVSHTPGEWHAVDWQQAHKHVRRLQARIVKATQEGRWGKVQSLQRLLTRSYSAKVLAVRRVTENEGRNTPGVDGEIWDTPQKKMDAVHRLRHRGYKPQPLRRMYVPKSNGKKRPLGIPTMTDRAMQALHLMALESVAETLADRNSYGFRKGRSAADAIAQCFHLLARGHSAQWILEADIKSCFDRISHEWLMEHIPMEKSILQKWLKAGYMEGQLLHPTDEGTPQGGIISPVLANMALDGLEKVLEARFPKPKSGYNAKVNLVRYADDFIITGDTQELLEKEVIPLIETFLHERGLELSQEKTSITHIEDGFDFLGQNIRKYNRKLIIKPSEKSVKALLEKVRGILRRNRQMAAGKLIMVLNPVIRGWAQYHRHVCSSQTFHTVDHHIFQALWKWALRRHPNKGRRWVKDKYFPPMGDQNWLFQGDDAGRHRWLTRCTDLSIKRHVKIRGDANPFDPAWEMYFEERLSKQMLNTFDGRRQLIRLWKSQDGICPVCKLKITSETGWHNHHVIQSALGGSDKDENRVLLHPDCHRYVHSQHLHVEKPRPSRGVTKA
jgi:RNA-directed DNA polymerase